jgi:urease accessory protein
MALKSPRASKRLYGQRSQARNGRTSHLTLRTEAPLELRGPFSSGDCGPMYFLRNVSAGIFGGDKYNVVLEAKEGARVKVAASSAEKAYDARGRMARLDWSLVAHSGSSLSVGPQPLILQTGAAVGQTLRCRVHGGAAIVLAECVSFGRLSRGERLDFDVYAQHVVVDDGTVRLFEERYVLRPGPALDVMLGGYGVLATVYLLGEQRVPLDDLLVLCAGDARVYAGASNLPNSAGRVLKALAPSLTDGIAFCRRVLSLT